MKELGTWEYPMVRIVQGTEKALSRYFAEYVSKARNQIIAIGNPIDVYRSWAGIRSTLFRVGEMEDRDTVRHVLNAHRAAVAVVKADACGPLSQEDVLKKNEYEAKIDSQLSHNWSLNRPLFEEWATVLIDLLSDREFDIVVPDLNFLDWESAAVLLTLARLTAGDRVNLIIGYDQNRTETLDDCGISWAPISQSNAATIAYGLLMLDRAESILIEDISEKRSLEFKHHCILPEDVELQVWNAITNVDHVLSLEQAQQAILCIQQAFRRHSFTTALRLGVTLLDKKAKLEPWQAAEVHGIVGLSAHNRQFKSAKNLRLADFLERHFRAALDLEVRPAQRISLCYRLAVTLGRRKGDFKEAKIWADRAVEDASKAHLPELQRSLLSAWGRNIRAYLMMRSGEIAAAVKDCEEAFRLLCEEKGVYSTRDAIFTLSLLAHNLAALSVMDGNYSKAFSWKQKCSDIECNLAGTKKFSGLSSIGILRKLHALDLALSIALEAREHCKKELSPFLWFQYTLAAGDLTYRLGNPQKALAFYQEIRAVRRRIGNPAYLASTELSAAIAALRAGNLEECESLLHMAEKTYPPQFQSQIMLVNGLLAALRGDAAGANHSTNAAIEVAVQNGECVDLTRTAVRAGEVCNVLQRLGDAREAFERAIDIADAGDVAKNDAQLASEAFRALIGLQECDAPSLQLAIKALKLLPFALRTADTWWSLSRLLRILNQIGLGFADSFGEPALREPLEALVLSSHQREDCRASLASFLGMLGEPQAGRLKSLLQSRRRLQSQSLSNAASIAIST